MANTTTLRLTAAERLTYDRLVLRQAMRGLNATEATTMNRLDSKLAGRPVTYWTASR